MLKIRVKIKLARGTAMQSCILPQDKTAYIDSGSKPVCGLVGVQGVWTPQILLENFVKLPKKNDKLYFSTPFSDKTPAGTLLKPQILGVSAHQHCNIQTTFLNVVLLNMYREL